MILRLRPHHGMCLYYFQGKGYSDEFVLNMTKYKQLLETEDPLIRITEGIDDLCEKCPNNQNGICTSQNKVAAYDSDVLSACALDYNTILPYKEFSELVQQKILLAGKRREICADCQWNVLCSAES